MQLPANELRVGNFYFFHSPMMGDKIIERFDYWSDGLNFEAYGSGIPITAEILQKSGFISDECKVEWDIVLPIGNGSELFIEDEGDPYMSVGVKNENGFNYFRDIRFLHELQNLYFALTREELHIDLK